MGRTLTFGMDGRTYLNGRPLQQKKPAQPVERFHITPGTRCVYHGLRGDQRCEVVKVLEPYSLGGVQFRPVRVLVDGYERTVQAHQLAER